VSTLPSPSDRRRFVVERHRARRLHDDVRPEIDGMLVSWAVPKGPTLDPTARRLAVHVDSTSATTTPSTGGTPRIIRRR
jgi:bifunctional non-homologous end joining protein LigD